MDPPKKGTRLRLSWGVREERGGGEEGVRGYTASGLLCEVVIVLIIFIRRGAPVAVVGPVWHPGVGGGGSG